MTDATPDPATARFGALPAPVPLDGLTYEVPAAAPPDPDGGRDPLADALVDRA